MNNQEPELYANSVKNVEGWLPRSRQYARNLFLNMQSLSTSTAKDSFVRGLYLHYVFDDQRIEFESKIIELKGLGEFVKTEDMVSMVKGEVPVDGKYFHLSFDDGLDCVYRNAAPILNDYGVPAIMFVNSGVINSDDQDVRSEWDEATNYRIPLKIMDWSALNASGFEVGAHTRNHLRLSEISGNKFLLHDEVYGCKRDIEEAMGRECKYFAWPYGTLSDVDEKSIQEIKSAGYEAAFGVYRVQIEPKVTNPFMIPRHHFEPQWPLRHVRYFACGGLEKNVSLPNWGNDV